MFAWLLRRRLIATNPFSSVEIRIRLPERLPRCVAWAEMAALATAIKGAGELTRLATLLLLSTGVRVSELTSICIGDVDLLNGSIRIQGKGSRERFVYVTDASTRLLLRDYIHSYRRRAPATASRTM